MSAVVIVAREMYEGNFVDHWVLMYQRDASFRRGPESIDLFLDRHNVRVSGWI